MITQEKILVTGASSGIGYELTERLLKQKNIVIGLARNLEPLKPLLDNYENLHVVACDITDKTSVSKAKRELESITSHLDRIILNAGDCQYLDPHDMKWDAVYNMMNVNFFGQINCIDLCFDFLVKSEAPHIIYISSQAINAPFSRAEAYGASKAASDYFFNSLRIDLSPIGIDVSVIRPGFVTTPLTQLNDFSMPFKQTVSEAVTRILKGMEQRKLQFTFPKRLSLLLSVIRWFPKLWVKSSRPKTGSVQFASRETE